MASKLEIAPTLGVESKSNFTDISGISVFNNLKSPKVGHIVSVLLQYYHIIRFLGNFWTSEDATRI